MAINYPVSLDDFANVSTGDTIAASHKNDLNDAAEALMSKVGIDNSAVATSHDYLLKNLPAQAQNWDAGAVEVRAQTLESDVATGTAPLTITSTTVVTNLNADTVDGKHVAGTNGAGEITTNDGTQTLTGKTLTSPTLTTPALGVATATSINKVAVTAPATSATLTIADTKTLTVTGDATISATPYVPSGTDVAIADGGTGASTAQAAINALAGGVTADKVLRGNGSNILLAAVNMATDVTGILAAANGGTGGTTAPMLYADTRFKLGQATRDLTTASGTQAITGVGFQPKIVIVLMALDGAVSNFSIGFSDGTSNYQINQLSTGLMSGSNPVCIAYTEVANTYFGSITTLGADGFTITWTKTNSPTGTLYLNYLALR